MSLGKSHQIYVCSISCSSNSLQGSSWSSDDTIFCFILHFCGRFLLHSTTKWGLSFQFGPTSHITNPTVARAVVTFSCCLVQHIFVHALEGQCLTYRTPLEQFPGAPFVPCLWCTLVPPFCNLTRSKLLKTLPCPRYVVHFLLQPLCRYCSALHCRQINFRVRFQSEKLWNKWDFDNPRKHCEEKRATCAGV